MATFNPRKILPSFLLGASSCLFAVEGVTVQTKDTGAAMINPGMGWTMHYYSNVPANLSYATPEWVRNAGILILGSGNKFQN